jgi:hypothetical protein
MLYRVQDPGQNNFNFHKINYSSLFLGETIANTETLFGAFSPSLIDAVNFSLLMVQKTIPRLAHP